MEGDFPPYRESGVLAVPAPDASQVAVRFAPISSRDEFDPTDWRHERLSEHDDAAGWYQIDLDELDVPDGEYEYEFVLDADSDDPTVAPDPFAEELTRFQGYRGTFTIRDGQRSRPSFSWEGELSEDGLPANNELVIYELPLRWVEPASDYERDVPDGDIQDLVTDHLDHIADLGVNAIELLPIQDAPVSISWGYGSRFFFAPDLDFGGPIDAKFLIKECHRRGIRVLMDVVINHATESPLEPLADEWFFLDPDEKPDRPAWGGRRFDFTESVEDYNPGQEFLHRMGRYWVEEYHVDGFRLDEFKGADHWEFVQEFRDRTRAVQEELFPDRPFLVVAEDSWNRTQITHDDEDNPDGRSVVDSMWNFSFREESRQLLKDDIDPAEDEPPRSERIEALISGDRTWDDRESAFDDGFEDLSMAVNYVTSHDMGEPGEQRLMNYIFGALVREQGLGEGSVENVQYLLDNLTTAAPEVQIDAHQEALDRVRGAFAVLLTSAGIPMFLAGEEFGEIHDLEYTHWKRKMEDPINWNRIDYPGHETLRESVQDLIDLRTSTAALQRNEVEFFYTHPEIDDDVGKRAFAYCRTGGEAIGAHDQVVVVANFGPHRLEELDVPWPWTDTDRITERGEPLRGGDDPAFDPEAEGMTLTLEPFQVRVFET